MEIQCEECNGNIWKAILHELKFMGQSVVYSALKCEGCGMVIPLTQLGKNQSKDVIKQMLKP